LWYRINDKVFRGVSQFLGKRGLMKMGTDEDMEGEIDGDEEILRGNQKASEPVHSVDIQSTENNSSTTKVQKRQSFGGSSKQRKSLRLPPQPFPIEPPGDSIPIQTEKAGTVTTREEAARLKEIADISMRKILAIVLTIFILLCMAAYFIYMMLVNDSKGLASFITILVGILGIITGYYFSSRKETGN
jgi:hypothetical protein